MASPAGPDDAVVNAAVAAVMEAFSGRQAEVARTVQRELAAEIADLRDDPGLVQLLGASVEGNVDAIFWALRHQIPIENIAAPTAALEYARRLAQRGVAMNALVRAYRLGHGLVLNNAADVVNGMGFEPRVGLAAFERITAITFHYIDWISQQVVVVYEQERDRWLANRNSGREMRVREVLDGTDGDPDAITAAIGYPMHRTHLALVLWRPEPSEHGDELVGLERFLRRLAETLPAQGGSLFVAADRVSGWGWIPVQPSASGVSADVRRFVAQRPDAPAVALGSPAPGVAGFRRSHRLARRAHDVAVAAGSIAGRVTAADDPGLSAAAMLGADLDEARQWVSDVLGPLAGDTDADARLRDTLRVFLRHGSSYKSAADELNLHFNSVKYRVSRALARRGRPIGEDRLDVELALLACHWFGAAVLR